MSQNVYDRASFFTEYSKLPRSVHGLSHAPEWPTLRSLVGDVTSQSVLDLGCGFGWFCRWAHSSGASSVHGIDLSANMLARAHADTPPNSGITYEQADLGTVALRSAAYDLVYSSLALHYIPDVSPLLARVHASLKPGGRFVFSVEHPVFTAPEKKDFERDADGKLFWPLTKYVDEGLRVSDWLDKDIRKYHRRTDTYVNLLLQLGFEITGFKEFVWEMVWEDDTPAAPNERYGHKPDFLIVAVQKRRDAK